MYNTAIYPGTFDPFTNGHLDIVKKSAKIFNEVYVVIGINNKKIRTYDIDDMRQAVEETLAECRLDNCKVIIYNGLIGQFTQDNNCLLYTSSSQRRIKCDRLFFRAGGGEPECEIYYYALRVRRYGKGGFQSKTQAGDTGCDSE